MIYHIMPYCQAFTFDVINMIQSKLHGVHFFYVFCFSEMASRDIPQNVTVVRLNKRNLIGYYLSTLYMIVYFVYIICAKKAIIFHSLFLPAIFFQIMFFIPSYKKKNWNWIVFGGDIYDKREYLEASILRKIYFKLKTLAVRNFGHITTLTNGDYDIARQYYDVCGQKHVVVYGDAQNLFSVISRAFESRTKNAQPGTKIPVKIMIGNSATCENQHEEALMILSKYKKENVEILLPLSYGDKGYAAKIEQLGIQIFHDKIRAIREYMSFNDYILFLSSIDIAIFNNNRQQAMGNIIMLLGLGKKVYLRTDTSMWEYYNDLIGIKLSSVESIKNLSFKDFLFYPEKEKNNNIKNLFKYYNDDALRVKEWNEIIDAMGK